jgi:RNA processing factor Prp31
MSFESASEIEALSWETTGKLVDAFSDEEIDVNVVIEEKITELTPLLNENDFFASLEEAEIAFIKAAISENFDEQGSIAVKAGSLADVIADKINSLSADMRGDILLEDIGIGYAVLEDYIEETKGALNYDG